MMVSVLTTVEVTEWEEISVTEDEPLSDDVVKAAAEEWANTHSFHLVEVHEWKRP